MDLQKKLYSFLYEYWKLIKQYTPIPNNEDMPAWDKLIEEAEDMLKRYDDGSVEYDFFKGLVFTWFDYASSVNKAKQDANSI